VLRVEPRYSRTLGLMTKLSFGDEPWRASRSRLCPNRAGLRQDVDNSVGSDVYNGTICSIARDHGEFWRRFVETGRLCAYPTTR
jgi:hypothetical protein